MEGKLFHLKLLFDFPWIIWTDNKNTRPEYINKFIEEVRAKNIRTQRRYSEKEIVKEIVTLLNEVNAPNKYEVVDAEILTYF